MRTEAQYARLDLELAAIDSALTITHWWMKPTANTWSEYLKELDRKLVDEFHWRGIRS